MAFLLFVCFTVLGVVSSSNGITDIHRGDEFIAELGLDTKLNDFKDQLNSKYEENYEYVEDLIEHDKYQFSIKQTKEQLDWWQTGIIYEIYPRSFKDSNDNGVGDIRGIIEKIPYLKNLGVSCVWLTPIYPSPGFDLGYDISDYRGIDEMMGTMEDLEELIKKLHENGIKIMLDIVPNHTSYEHEWFIKSVQSIEPYTDYFVWANATYEDGVRKVPNNWRSIFGDTMWEWNEVRQQYYLHQFFKQQPDLNFWNPTVREEIHDLLTFWMDKGIDAFRMDAVPHIYEREDLLDAPIEWGFTKKVGYTEGLDECFYEANDWRTLTDEYKKKNGGQTKILIIETYLEPLSSMKFYGNETNPGAHFPLNTCLINLVHKSAKEYVEQLSEYMENLPSGAWPSWMIGNHDYVPRSASRFGVELLDGIHMIQLLLPGTPIIYTGDELGMSDLYLRDDQVMEGSKESGLRERVRTPFQWDTSPQAGFSNKTKTWLPVNPNYVTLNVESELNAKYSHFKIFNELMNLRQLDVFRTGDVKFYEISEYVFAFSRSNSFLKTYFVVVNFGSELEYINLKKFKKLMSSKLIVKISSMLAEQTNGDVINANSFTLRPSAALVLESSFH